MRRANCFIRVTSCANLINQLDVGKGREDGISWGQLQVGKGGLAPLNATVTRMLSLVSLDGATTLPNLHLAQIETSVQICPFLKQTSSI